MAAQFSFLENAFEGFRYQPAFIEPSDEDALVTRVREAFIVPTDENDLLNRLHKGLRRCERSRLAPARREYRSRSLVGV